MTALTLGIGAPGAAYEAKVTLGGATPARSHPDWVSANDFIYWRNGVCDRTFYDAGMADAAQVAVDPAAFAVTDDTEWATFTEPAPWRVLVVNSAMELVVSPWNNIDKLRSARRRPTSRRPSVPKRPVGDTGFAPPNLARNPPEAVRRRN